MVWLIVVGVGVLALLAALLWTLATPLSEADADADGDADDEMSPGEPADPEESWVPEYSDELD